MINSKRQFILSFDLRFVLVFLSPISLAITLLGTKTAFRAFVLRVLVGVSFAASELMGVAWGEKGGRLGVGG